MVDCLAEIGLNELSIKWPNDIYVGHRKIAGILIQNTLYNSSIKYCIVGIGLNVNQEIWDKEIPNPTSIKCTLGTETKITDVLNNVVKYIQHWYSLLVISGRATIDDFYSEHLYLKGEKHVFSIENGTTLDGTITGVNESGQLCLMVGRGIDIFDFRTIKFPVLNINTNN